MSALLEVDHLNVEFPLAHGAFAVLDDVSLTVRHREIVGLVGESGSGKSTTVRSIIGLHHPARITAGEVRLDGRELTTLDRRDLRQVRGNEIGFVAQNPFGALNPVLRIGRQFENVIRAHRKTARAEIRDRALHLLRSTGIPDPVRVLDGYAHELSGGMAQRTVIALALSLDPKLLIADEPTTALDLTVQRQVLDLIRTLVRDGGRSLLLVTHDLGVVANYCDRVVVMYGGRVVEEGEVASVFHQPRHPYTRELLASASAEFIGDGRRVAPPKMDRPRAGCNFAHRCPRVLERCRTERPALMAATTQTRVSCHNPVPVEVNDVVPAGR